MKVLFLDIDGVLNSTEWWHNRDNIPSFDPGGWGSMFERCVWDIDPEGLKLIEQVVVDSDCSIVISSSWRNLHTLDDIWTAFDMCATHHLQRNTLISRDRIIGQTPDAWKDFSSTPSSWGDVRGQEIAAWLKDHSVESYAIVDDDGDMLEEQKTNFVQTSHDVGITALHARKLTEILK